MFLIEVLFVDNQRLFVVRSADGRPLHSTFKLSEVSNFLDAHSNLPKSQDNKSAD